MDINMNMMNNLLCHTSHDNDDDHANNNKLYITTPAAAAAATAWDEHLNMIMKHHHHHHQQHHNHHQVQHGDTHEEQVIVPLLDQVWSNYQLLHTPTQSPTSIQLPTSSSSPLIINHHHHQVDEIHPRHQEGEEIEEEEDEEEEEELGAMKEMMYRIAVMQPVDIDPATIRKPKRRNVRISDDPQSVAARLRRERISEKIRILQRLVPGGTKLDTASMLDEAVRYVKFLKRQIRLLQKSSASTTALAPAPAPPPHHIPLLSPDWPGPGPGSSTSIGPGPSASLGPILGPASEESKVVGNMSSTA